MRLKIRLAAAAASVVGFSCAALAQVSGSWLNPYGGSWLEGINWTSNPLFPDGGGVATFGPNTWNQAAVNLGASSVSLSQVVINSPARFVLGGTINFTSGPAILNISGADALAPTGSPFNIVHELSRPVTVNGLIKNGSGPLLLTNFSVTGGTTINAGTLFIGANYPFPANSGSLTLNGGALAVADSITLSQLVHIGPNGGILRGGTSGSLPLNGGLDGSGALRLDGVNLTSGGISATVPLTYSGALDIRSGLTLFGNGVMPNVASMTISGLLSVSNNGSIVIDDRISNTAPITLRGAIVGGTLSGSTEAIGAVTLDRGLNIVGSNLLALSTPQLSRANRAVLDCGVSIRVTGTPPPVLGGGGPEGTTGVGVLPWTRRNDNNHVRAMTVAGDGTIRPLADAEYITFVPTGVTTSNLRLVDGGAVTVPAAVNSLSVGSTSNTLDTTLDGPATLTVSSGAVFLTYHPSNAVSTKILAPLDFGAAEGVIHSRLATPQRARIEGPISGSNGLTIAGALTLTGTSTYTGPTTIQGTLRLQTDVPSGTPGPVGADTSPVAIEAGRNATGLVFAPGPISVQFARDLVVRNYGVGSVSISVEPTGVPRQAVLTGDIELAEGAVTFQGQSPETSYMIVSGDVSGPGMIRDPANVVFTGNNSFTGGIETSSGPLGAGSDTAFGTGPLWITQKGGLFASGGPRTLANPVFSNGGFGITGNQPITFSGPFSLSGVQNSISIGATSTTTFSGPVINGALSKTGAGLLQITHGLGLPTLSVSGGEVRILPNGGNAGTSRLQSLSISSGCSFNLTDNDLVIDYSTTSPAASVRTILIDHRLNSSLADVSHTLGYGENSVLGYTTFSGQAVDSTSVLVKFTYFGDGDLDGDVDVNDLGKLATRWQSVGVWTDGDFDYSGTVDANDLGMLATNWQVGVGNPLGPSLAEAAASVGLPSVSVPEPAAMTLVGVVGGLSLLRKRRRQ